LQQSQGGNLTSEDTFKQEIVSTLVHPRILGALFLMIIAAFAGGASDILGGVQFIGAYLQGIFSNVLAFVVPATVVVGLKDIWALGKME